MGTFMPKHASKFIVPATLFVIGVVLAGCGSTATDNTPLDSTAPSTITNAATNISIPADNPWAPVCDIFCVRLEGVADANDDHCNNLTPAQEGDCIEQITEAILALSDKLLSDSKTEATSANGEVEALIDKGIHDDLIYNESGCSTTPADNCGDVRRDIQINAWTLHTILDVLASSQGSTTPTS